MYTSYHTDWRGLHLNMVVHWFLVAADKAGGPLYRHPKEAQLPWRLQHVYRYARVSHKDFHIFTSFHIFTTSLIRGRQNNIWNMLSNIGFR